MISEKYDLLTTEIKTFVNNFESNISLQPALKKHYRGTQILFSPLIHKPAFMFIGINPGIGYFKFYKKNVKRFNALQHFEYLHYNYLLASETKKVFEDAKLIHELKNSVKTNCFFFSTTTEKELHQLLSHLKKGQDVYGKCRSWLSQLVNIVDPQIIICEGKSAFDELVGKENQNVKTLNGCYFTIYNETPIIGYQRRLSRIVNKRELSVLIADTYESLSKQSTPQVRE